MASTTMVKARGAEPVLLREDRDGRVTLTLNRPDARNALSAPLLDEILRELAAVAAEPSARVVVIAANGPAFCAGHDFREMMAHRDEDYYRTLFNQSSRVMKALLRLPQPVIARIHGPAFAAGCQLVATCDLALAGKSVNFATPGVNIGLFCSTPMVAMSRNVGRKKAMEMLLLGQALSAEEAAAAGLINRAVPDAELDGAVDAYCERIMSKSRLVMKIGKEAFYRQLEMGIEEAYEYTAAVMARNMMTDDAAEGIDAFIAKRAPVWTGA